MNLFTREKEGVPAEIEDQKGEYAMDTTIGACNGDVLTTSAGDVIAEVFPGYQVCNLCKLVCSARVDL